MKPSVVDGTLAQQLAGSRELAAEMFHSLSQPLTVVQCSLELSLANDSSPQEFRASVEAALENTQRVRQRLDVAREMINADDPGDTSDAVSLELLLQRLAEELLPLAASQDCMLQVSGRPLRVRTNPGKLERAFFYLLEFLLSASDSGGCIQVQAAGDGQAEVAITASGCARSLVQGLQREDNAQLRVAHRILKALGGEWHAESQSLNEVCCTVYLPLAVE